MNNTKDKPWFSLQWHITSKCDQRCSHCYIFNSKEANKKEDLSFSTISKIMSDFFSSCKTLDVYPDIALTGGDPLLRNDFFQILSEINNKISKFGFGQFNIDIMGNPFHLNKDTCAKLKDHNISSYQLSLDGMENVHDSIRKKGGFRRTLEAIESLKNAGVNVHVMFTLSKTNSEDLFPLVRLLSEMNVDCFAFARLSRPEFMSLDDYKKISFYPDEYKHYLSRVKKLYDSTYSSEKNKTYFALKDHLWKLFMFEMGELSFVGGNRDIVCSGCNLGISNLSILSDGTVYACRRFKSKVGKVPDEKILDIFLNSKQLNFYRQLENFSKCSKCELLQYCRGCGAVAFNYSGSYFDPDPQCWKIVE